MVLENLEVKESTWPGKGREIKQKKNTGNLETSWRLLYSWILENVFIWTQQYRFLVDWNQRPTYRNILKTEKSQKIWSCLRRSAETVKTLTWIIQWKSTNFRIKKSGKTWLSREEVRKIHIVKAVTSVLEECGLELYKILEESSRGITS